MIFFVFKQLYGAGGSTPLLQEKKLRLRKIIAQDPTWLVFLKNINKWQGLDSNQRQLPDLKPCSSYHIMSQTLCQGLFRNER